MITLYDFKTKLPGTTLSPFVWKIRLALNIKGLKHQTHWISFSKIEQQLKELGLPPSSTAPNHFGTYHTVPGIYDSSTDTKVSDSRAILKYLDETYPDTPQLLSQPNGDPQLESFVAEAFAPAWGTPASMIRLLWRVIAPKIVLEGLEGEDAAKYRARVQAANGMSVEEWMENDAARGQCLAKAREAFDVADEWLQSAKKIHGGAWALGEAVTLADIELGTVLAFACSILGKDDRLWKQIIGEWNDGRWGVLWDQMGQYTRAM
ncbi:hypothetical protein D9611_007419 [Ephemerocybe angulata]|uniref:GST N-terminal domain-containing protein n=1 Tax=Ephemerocybe angulata TaxID=980116 RepID=A0A8H5CH62_9AGAR|nr:hypothetical protein D9611_007419 [Tulosesus angulatus]